MVRVTMLMLFCLSAGAHGTTLVAKQITFNGIGEEPLPMPTMIPYTRAPLPEGWTIWRESYTEPDWLEHSESQLYLDQGEGPVLLDSTDVLGGYGDFVWECDGDRVVWYKDWGGNCKLYTQGEIIDFGFNPNTSGWPVVGFGCDFVVCMPGVPGDPRVYLTATMEFPELAFEMRPFSYNIGFLTCEAYANGIKLVGPVLYWDGSGLYEDENCIGGADETFWIAIPEPVTVSLLGLGFLAVQRRRRRESGRHG